MEPYFDAPSLVATVGVLVLGAAVLFVLLARRRIPERGRVLAIVGAALALGFAAIAGAGLSQLADMPDHSLAMSQCVYYRSLDYPTLSKQAATAKATARCEKQLADDPGSFDYTWPS